MRTISVLLLAVACVAFAEIYDENVHTSTLKPGTEYVYKYESQVLNGIPGSDNQYSGMRIKCSVRIHFKRDSIAMLKLEDVHLCEINSHFMTLLPTEMQRDVPCLPATEHTQVVEEQLRKAISFRWTAGLVSHLETEVSDPHWSVNVKRGVLNLLHVSLSQDTESRDLSPELFDEYSAHNMLVKDRSVDKMFVSKEHDVVGKCETVYAIHDKLPVSSSVESFKVSKVKDYRDCRDKVLYEQGIFSGSATWLHLTKDDRRDMIKPLTCTEYEMTGARDSFLIRSAKLNSKYIFTPFTTEGGSFVTYMKQHLDLETSSPIRSPIIIVRPVMHASALELHIPHSLATMSKESLMSGKDIHHGRLSAEFVGGKTATGAQRKWYTSRTSDRPYRYGGKTVDSETSEEMSKMMRGTRESETSEESDEILGKGAMWASRDSATAEESDEEPWAARRHHDYRTSEDTRKYMRKFKLDETLEDEEDSTLEIDDSSVKITAMKTLLKEIVASMIPFITEETTSKMILLTRRLQFLTSSELSTLIMHYSKFSESVSEVRKIREILLDCLPVVPKSVVPKIIKSLAVKGIIYPKRAAYMLALHALTAPPSPATLKSLLKVCRCPELTTLDSQVLRTCWLGVGSLTYKLSLLHLKTRVDKSISFAVIDEAVKEVKLMLTSSHEEKRFLALAVIGNAGLPDFLPEIKRIISDKSLPHSLRLHAMCSLRRMTILSPTKVVKVVLPIVMNTHESTSLRIGALTIAFHALPQTAYLELMVHRLRHDPSVELKSFIYSSISTCAKSNLPEYSRVARKCKTLMMLMKPYDFGIGHSKGYFADVFSDKINVGISTSTFIINSPTSYLPSLICTRLAAIFAHQPLYLFEFGVSMKGLDDILSNVAYAQNVWKKMMAGEFKIADFLSPYEFSDFGSVHESIKSILEKVKIEDRMFEKPEVMAVFRLINSELTYFNIDRKTITDLLSINEHMSYLYTSSPVPFPVDIVKTLPLVDNCVIVPTPIGLPISLNLTAIAVAHVHGLITPHQIPSIRELLFSRSLPSELKVTLDLKPSFAIQTSVSLGVDMTVIKASAAVKGSLHSHFPLSSEISVKPAEGKLKITWDIPQTQFTPLKAKVKVVTLLKKMPVRSMPVVTSWRDEKELPQTDALKTIPIQIPTVLPVSGLRVDVVGKVSYRRSAWAPFHPMACGQHIEIICRPSEERPKTVELKVKFDSSSTVPFLDLYDTYMGKSSVVASSSEVDYEDVYSKQSSRHDSSRFPFFDEDVLESDFASVTPFSDITSPSSSRLCMSVKTLGGSRERSVKALLTWSRSPLYLVHHVNFQLVGSPLISHLDLPTKFMFDGILNIPHIFSPSRDSLIAKVTMGFGDSAYTTSALSLKILAGSTGYSWTSEHSPLREYISTVPSTLPEKFEYYAVINYQKIPVPLADAISTYYELVKVITYPYLYVRKYSEGLTSTPSGQITVYVKCVPAHKKISAVIRTPTESDIIIDLPSFNPLFARETLSLVVPALVHKTEGYDADASTEDFTTYSDMTPSYTYWKPWTAECKLSNSRVETFDSVSYKVPELSSACETVIARDCSHRGLFTIISSPLVYKVKVLLPHYEIAVHVEPTTYAYDVKINGVAKDISTSRSLYLPEYPTLSSSDNAYEITKEGDVVKIYCSKIGLTIKVGSYLSIKVSSLFRGRMCGLCGNFNGERFDEYEGPSKIIYDRPEHSVIKYLVPSENCRVGEYTTKYGLIPDTKHSEECITEMRNVAKTIFKEGKRMVCFTRIPEPVCSEGCRRMAVTRKTVAFHCLPALELSTDTLLKESLRRPLNELYSKRIDLYDTIETQERCVPGA